MAQHNHADDEQQTTNYGQTTTVYFQDTSGQGLTATFSDRENYRCKDSEEFKNYASGVSEGDYVAVVYQTPSNGGSLLRSTGTITDVERLPDSVDIRFEDDDGEAYLHTNAGTGDYYFTSGTNEQVKNGRRVEKIAWTPEGDD